jgi:hypothetical protein
LNVLFERSETCPDLARQLTFGGGGNYLSLNSLLLMAF